MAIREARCTCQGETFFGVYEVEGEGDIETVRVRFHGDETSSTTCGLPASTVASTLLGELVTTRIKAGTIRRPLEPSSRDAPEDLAQRMRKSAMAAKRR